ncbi:MAG: PD40 domain-containing protein [Planctomycetes bacterium]|nr:PD40 domain-containing protein [Planctomycetota bacterium]
MRVFFACFFVCLSAAAQVTTRVSVSSNGTQGDNNSGLAGVALSADGRFVAFHSDATTLVAGDTNGFGDIFVRDRDSGQTTRASVSTLGTQGNADSFLPAISADGRFVAFHSDASNLVAGDVNGFEDVFVRDRVAGTTVLASVSTGGTQGNGIAFAPAISGDGRYVAFSSDSTTFAPSDTNGAVDVFVRDLIAGTTTRVSVDSMGNEADTDSFFGAISADGRFVAFGSAATNLVAGDTNGSNDVFVHDMQTGATTRVSVPVGGGEGDANSEVPTISGDGRVVAFRSDATNLVPGDVNATTDIFAVDTSTGVVTRVSVDSMGTPSDSFSFLQSVSADGRYVAFDSNGSNLAANDTNGIGDIFVHDLQSGETTLVSISSAGEAADSISNAPATSANGRFIAFQSFASNLVLNQTNGFSDIFVRDLEPCARGDVNATTGPIADVLRVNGQTGGVIVPLFTPIDVTLAASPAGPDPANYGLWIWRGYPSRQVDLVVGGQRVGCTVNPTPLQAHQSPQPYLCLRSSLGVPSRFCGTARELPSPTRAPWQLHRPQGFNRAIAVTLQGLLLDVGSTHPSGFSVTNAIVLVVR